MSGLIKFLGVCVYGGGVFSLISLIIMHPY